MSREALRDTDVLGRWGGAEFLLIMRAVRRPERRPRLVRVADRRATRHQ